MSGESTKLSELAIQTLEKARVEVVDRLKAAGLPLSLVSERTVVTGTETSYQTANQPVNASGLKDIQAQLAIGDDSIPHLPIGLKEQLEPLAEHISENSDLGKKRKSGFFPSLTGSEGVLVRVVHPFAFHYLTRLSDIGTPDPTLATELAQELEQYVRSGRQVQVKQVLVGGITVESELSHKDIHIRPLTEVETGAYLRTQNAYLFDPVGSDSDLFMPRSHDFFVPTTVVEERHEVELDTPLGHVSASRLIKLALASFLSDIALRSTGLVSGFELPVWISSGYTTGEFPVKRKKASAEPQSLDEPTFSAVVDLADQIPDFTGSEASRTDIVFNRVLTGYGSDDSGFLDFVIALESALLKGIKQELRYRFALYGALFLRDKFPPEETFEKLKAVYDMRSDVVHGSSVKAADREKIEKDAEVLAGAVALEIIQKGWPSHSELNALALTFPNS